MIRIAGAVAASILVALGAAYYQTVEPAPEVRVRWREDVSDARRSELEQRFLLVTPRLDDGRTYVYDLLDTSQDNLTALVRSPEVEDTAGIDRLRYRLPLDYRYSQSWMWVAHRLPVLRGRGVVEGIAAACAAALLAIAGWRLRRRARRT